MNSEINALTEKIIGCAIEVHRTLGPGLLESIYETAMCAELEEAGLKFERQVIVPVLYKGRNIGRHRIDLIVEDAVIVEIKAVERFDAIFEAQVLTYPRLACGRAATEAGQRRGVPCRRPSPDEKTVPTEAVGGMLAGGWEGKMEILAESNTATSCLGCAEYVLPSQR